MSNGSRNKSLIFIIAVLLLANITLVYLYVFNNTNKQPASNTALLLDKLEKEVGFNKEQISAAEKMKQAHHEKMILVLNDLRSAKDSFYILLNRNVPDSVMQASLKLIGEKQEAANLQVFLNYKELRTLCKPDQLQKFDSIAQRLLRKMTNRYTTKTNPQPTDSIK